MRCFNPRTHTGCDTALQDLQNDSYKFQSTHPHGVRHCYGETFRRFKGFQSTHPHGVRQKGSTYPRGPVEVSIHAPTRGATWYCSRYHTQTPCFNPRTHTGCDIVKGVEPDGLIMFQSTHPHGVRLPRPCLLSQPLLVSIHAPTRGATPLVVRITAEPSVSIHAPTRGATHRSRGL